MTDSPQLFKSYTGFEPAAMRGKQNNYNSYLQTKNRLEQLRRIGHPTDKIDLIVQGVKRSDLHDLALNRAIEKGYEIREIRYREIGHSSKSTGIRW